MCVGSGFHMPEKKFYCIARTWSVILSRLKILHADKRIFYLLLTYLMVPATQPAWRQERRTERHSDSEASK